MIEKMRDVRFAARAWAIRGLLLMATVLAGRSTRSSWSALISPKVGKRDDPDDGSQNAGVPARLMPPPPPLFAVAANALPEPDEEAA
jgi:hypothetical protein